jgi:hypothetical protein
MSETRTFQGHTYTRNGPGEQWTLVPQAGGRAGVVITDPYRAKDESRKDTSTALDAKRADIQDRNLTREIDRTRLQNPQDLRQEYEKLQEVVQYKEALKQARKAMDTDADPQGDLALTYAFAKAMDPSSAVREGEQASVAGSQSVIDAAVERFKKTFKMDGAGSYTPQARAALRQQVFRAIAAIKPLYDRARADMSDNAKAVGVDPKEVVGRDDTATFAPMFRDYGEKNGDPQGVISRLVGGDPIKGATIATPDAGPMKSAGYGATETSIKIPPEMQAEEATYLNQNWGKLDPSGYAAFRINLDRKYGFTSDPEAYRAEVPKMNEFATKGGRADQMGAIPAPDRPLNAVEQLRNDAVSNKYGAAAATTMNGVGFGLPSLFAGDQFNAIRKDQPGGALVGDIAGGVIGSMTGGAALKAGSSALGGGSTIARILANPLTADVAYGGIYGANDAAGRGENAVVGGLTGMGGGFIGNKVGGGIAKAFPGAVRPMATRGLDASVPTSDDLKTVASGLYTNMEANGLTAAPADTFALADSTKKILADAGKITPKDNLAATSGQTNTAYKLISDFAGEPMDPAQYQTVRTVIADGLNSPEKSDRRVAKALLKNFDTWTDATNPAMKETWDDARAVSSRYLQGDALKEAGDLAGVRAGQFSQAGMENALRVDYRQLARKAIKSQGDRFTPEVTDAIGTVVDGTRLNNTLRTIGSLAPVSPSGVRNSILTMGGTAGIGAATGLGGGTGALGGAALGVGSLIARQLSQSLTKRAAQVAENTAYGGPEYAQALQALIARAGETGGDVGTGLIVGGTEPPINDAVARALAASNGAY